MWYSLENVEGGLSFSTFPDAPSSSVELFGQVNTDQGRILNENIHIPRVSRGRFPGLPE
jgi:hypothetical protein